VSREKISSYEETELESGFDAVAILGDLVTLSTRSGSERDAEILRLRFGLADGEIHTLESIGQCCDPPITRERVRQILDKCLRTKRRKPLGHPAVAALMLQARDAVAPHRENWEYRLYSFAAEILRCPPAADAIAALLRVPNVKEAVARGRRQYRERAKELRAAEIASWRQGRRDDSVLRLFDIALRPSVLAASRPPGVSHAARSVRDDGDGLSGAFWSQKLKRDVQYESTLEARLLGLLEGASIVTYYQEQAPAVYISPHGRYVPDVYVELADGRRLVIEVKPVIEMGMADQIEKWNAACRWCIRHGVGFLVTDGRRDCRTLSAAELPPSYDDLLRDVIARGGSWPHYRYRASHLGAYSTALTIAALRGKVRVLREPLRLATAAEPPGTFLASLSSGELASRQLPPG
jgi:hypothetical protein